MSHTPPVVLVIAGHDPSGGAGITADIQAVTANGAHPATVITALTVQDTADVHAVEPVTTALARDQIDVLVKDLDIAAVKIGLLATAGIARCVSEALDHLDGVPVVVDPVLVAAGGGRLARDDLLDVLKEELVPRATVLTPNAHEIRALVPESDDPIANATTLAGNGADYVLVKGGDENTADVRNILVAREGVAREWVWPRLKGRFHGSGCTLASAIAALLARGSNVEDAVAEAQQYTHRALGQAFVPGHGRAIPSRGACD